METRANYILIGLFTLAVIVGAFGFVYWFHNVGGTGTRVAYRVVFQTPISGLRAGAGVVFNGIRVGEVTELSLDAKNPQQSVARIAVDAATPIRADTKASLEFQGLTGIASLSLKGGSQGAGALVARNGEMPTLVADTSGTQDVMQSARDVMVRLESFLQENQAALKNSIANIETFTDTLARNSDRLDRVMSGLDNVIGGPDGKGEIPEAARAIRNAAENLDKRIDTLTTDARRTLSTVDKTIRNIDRNPSRLIFGGGQPAFPEKTAR
jgi:phospholipid/cholesterol/gamma-HCH transport system substrate-binding protein